MQRLADHGATDNSSAGLRSTLAVLLLVQRIDADHGQKQNGEDERLHFGGIGRILVRVLTVE